MLKALFAVLVLLFSQQTSSPIRQHDNPYCDKEKEDFTPPQGPINCGPGETLSQACIDGCYDYFQVMMVGGSDEACDTYDENYLSYATLVTEILLARTDCINSGGSRADCWRQYNKNLNEANADYDVAQGKIVDFMDAYELIAIAAFWNCASTCCTTPARVVGLPFDISIYGTLIKV